jgi:hypothetical protein
LRRRRSGLRIASPPRFFLETNAEIGKITLLMQVAWIRAFQAALERRSAEETKGQVKMTMAGQKIGDCPYFLPIFYSIETIPGFTCSPKGFLARSITQKSPLSC